MTPVTGGPGPSLAGGSEVYRINPDGSPRKVWSSAQDIVYAIGFDAGGLPLVGTGNRGKIYRLDSDTVSTLLLDASPTQVTGFGRAPGTGSKPGDLYAITGNIGKVFRIGPGFEKKGTFESPVLDAGAFAYWGRMSYRGLGKITVLTRSGNRSHPESNWSPGPPLQPEHTAARCESCGAGRTVSPSARFLQYKIDLTPAPGQPEPEVSYVEVAYLPKNVAPGGRRRRDHAGQLSLPRSVAFHHAVQFHHAFAHRPAKAVIACVARKPGRLADLELRERLRRRALGGVG